MSAIKSYEGLRDKTALILAAYDESRKVLSCESMRARNGWELREELSALLRSDEARALLVARLDAKLASAFASARKEADSFKDGAPAKVESIPVPREEAAE